MVSDLTVLQNAKIAKSQNLKILFLFEILYVGDFIRGGSNCIRNLRISESQGYKLQSRKNIFFFFFILN